MALNKNHEFEDVNGIKCCIVERTVSQERMQFLKALLEGNCYTVVVAEIAPKAAPVPAPKEGEEAVEVPPAPSGPILYTVGVTDLTFNSVNAIFGRFLRTKEGDVVTLKYWQQKESVSNDAVPYFE
jgi:hypothetical protein